MDHLEQLNVNESKTKKKMNFKTKFIIIGVVILVFTNIITFLLTANGYIHFQNTMVIKNDDAVVLKELSKINDLERVIQRDYYKDIDAQTLMNGALSGLFESTGDVYSYYYTKDEFAFMQGTESGQFDGIGVLVSEDENGDTYVVTPYKGTPAGDAGILPGDVIAKVDGEDMHGKGVNYAASKMRGEKGSKVNVTINRGEEVLEFTLTRDTINIQSVNSQIVGNNIGYIEITEFIETTGNDFEKALNDLEAQGITGLIIDLRLNGGGLVDQAVQVADRLLDDGLVVYTMDKAGNRQEYNASTPEHCDLPMVVLVNEGTASASEILSGALQDRGAAKILGTQTFGKGIVQIVQGLTDGSGFQLTGFEYFTPKDRNIHEVGLTPDVPVDMDLSVLANKETLTEKDVQFQKAIELLTQ